MVKIIRESRLEGEEGILNISIDTQNGAVLAGRFYDSDSKKGVIMIPGVTEHRSSLYQIANKLATDFKVAVFDLNSQGDSSGVWDLRQMIGSVDYLQRELKSRYGLSGIGGLGNSAGANAVGIAAAKKDSELECLCFVSPLSSLQEIVPEWALKIGERIPQALVRGVSILVDMIQTYGFCSPNYIRKSHARFKQAGSYQTYAQYGALKIPSLKRIVQLLRESPRLTDHAHQIYQPTLVIYGGEDPVLRVHDSRLPENLQNLFNSIGSSDKRLVIADGADHCLNSKTPIFSDDDTNNDPKYSWIKEKIVEHFKTRMF